MSQQKLNIIIVAHPDDESLFFASLPLSIDQETFWVVCVTDANADQQGAMRKGQFETATRALGVDQTFWFGLPDIYENRLEAKSLQPHLNSIYKKAVSFFLENTDHQKPDKPPISQTDEQNPSLEHLRIFTHGPLGEYMHPHHQDVSYATHSFFEGICEVYSPAYNTYPEMLFTLNKEAFDKKMDILNAVYGSETRKFLNLIPASWCEGFLRVSLTEVKEIYLYLSGKSDKLDKRSLNYFEPLHLFIEQKKTVDGKRLF